MNVDIKAEHDDNDRSSDRRLMAPHIPHMHRPHAASLSTFIANEKIA